MLKRKLKIEVKVLKPLAVMTLLALPVLALTSFVSALLSYCMPDILNIILSGGIGAGLFLLLSVMFNVINFQTYFVQFKDKFNFFKKFKKTGQKSSKNHKFYDIF